MGALKKLSNNQKIKRFIQTVLGRVKEAENRTIGSDNRLLFVVVIVPIDYCSRKYITVLKY